MSLFHLEKDWVVVVLAGGESDRFGCCKQVISFQRMPLVSWAVKAALFCNVKKVFVIIGAYRLEIIRNLPFSHKLEFLVNYEFKRGIGTSLGLVAHKSYDLKARGLLILLGDTPLVSFESIFRVIRNAAFSSLGMTTGLIVKKKCHPIAFDKRYFGKLMELKKDHGAKNILLSLGENIESIRVEFLESCDIDIRYDLKRSVFS